MTDTPKLTKHELRNIIIALEGRIRDLELENERSQWPALSEQRFKDIDQCKSAKAKIEGRLL